MNITLDGTTYDVKTLIERERIQQRVEEIAQQISQDYSDLQHPLVVLVVLHGALIFAADLVRQLKLPTEIESIRLKSYEGTSSTGTVKVTSPLTQSLKGRDVLVVEDIVDTGNSLKALKETLAAEEVNSVKVASLLDKPEAHQVQGMTPDYTGFQIGKNFVIGYGLDLNGEYRNLPYIAELVK